MAKYFLIKPLSNSFFYKNISLILIFFNVHKGAEIEYFKWD